MIYFFLSILLFHSLRCSEKPNRYKIEKQSIANTLQPDLEENKSDDLLIKTIGWAITEYPENTYVIGSQLRFERAIASHQSFLLVSNKKGTKEKIK